MNDRKEQPRDGEERFFWGGNGSTQPYSETYYTSTGMWHKDHL